MVGKVAVVTGANSGIGLAACEQLLSLHSCLTLCLACRNQERAEQARETLLASYPSATIDIIIIDTARVKSVLTAVQELRQKYTHIDFLYLNAGVMQADGVRWSRFLSGLFSSRCAYMLTTGEGLIVQKNSKTDEGLMNVFATNLFGHYVMVRELEQCLGSMGSKNECSSQSQLIWTSSSNAHHSNFSLEDLQHEQGEEPYSSSKYATDMLSLALNEKFNKQGIYSHSTCPGLVMTNMTNGILPAWFWSLVLPIMLLMRLFVHSMTNTPANGAFALTWLSQQSPASLDPGTKFQSLCSITGKSYVGKEKMKVDADESSVLLKRLEEMKMEFVHHYKCKS